MISSFFPKPVCTIRQRCELCTKRYAQILSLLVTISLIVGFLPQHVYAYGENQTDSIRSSLHNAEGSTSSPYPECIKRPGKGNTGRFLVLIRGWRSSGSGYDSLRAQWEPLISEIEDLYSGIVIFSYNRSTPEEYTDIDSRRSIFTHHVSLLRDLLVSCDIEYDVSSYDLVGHSMGGVVALEYIKAYGTLTGTRGRVKHVIPLHSPVHGVSELVLAKSFGIPTSDPAAQDMLSIYRSRATYQKANANAVRILGSVPHEYRVYIRAFSSSDDLAVDQDAANIVHFDNQGRVNGSSTEFYSLGGWGNTLGHNEVINQRSPAADKVRLAIRSALQVDPTLGGTSPPNPMPVKPLPETSGATFTRVEFPSDSFTGTPGQPLRKTWQMRNTGNTTWGAGYRLVFTGGRQMGAPNDVAIPAATPGQTVELALNVTVPTDGGTHRGYWQLRNPQGTFFGDRLWVQVRVPDSAANPPTTGGASITLECIDCLATVAPGQKFRPVIRAMVHTGQLLGVDLRGDMLHHKFGERFGAYPFVAVPGSTVINPGQSHTFQFYADNPITAPASPGVYESVWQIWRNGGWDGPEFKLRFEVVSSQPSSRRPNPPTLTGPGDWGVYYGGQTIQLTTQHNGHPDGHVITHYYFEIFESAQNPNSGWITSNTWSPQGLGFNGYQWRAKVRDQHGVESEWSPQVWRFGLLTNEPVIHSFSYQLCRPAWGHYDQYCFCATTNAGALRLQVNSATDGSDRGNWQVLNELGVPNYDCNNDNDRPPTWTHLEYETGRHLVRLFARRDGGWESAAHRDIFIDLPANRRPDSPHPILPTRRSHVNSRTVTLEWAKTLRTSHYRLRISTDKDFTTLLVDTTLPPETPRYTHTFAQDHPAVYWSVTAQGPYGENQNGSEFYIDRTAPATSMGPLPVAVIDTQFTVSWNATDQQSGVNWYHIQVRDGNRIDSQWQDWVVNTTKTTEIFNGLPGHSYYFRMRAMDKIGNWSAWPPGDGHIVTRVDPDSAPPTPWWNNAYDGRRALLILNNDSDTMPAGYPVRIVLDAGTTPTAAAIYDASLSAVKGDDIRIVYDNTTELDRVILSFTPGRIEIIFAVQHAIGGSQASAERHFLYFGNPLAGTPSVNLNNVYLPKADGSTMGLWRFQEGAGGTVHDASGRGHHGTFYNPSWGVGLLGMTGVFNGSSTFVQIPHSDDFRPGAMTLEAWVYLNGSTGSFPRIYDKDRYYLRVSNDRNIQFSIRADGGDRRMTSNGRLNPGEWYHVAATYDGNQRMRIFINGRVDKEETFGAPPSNWNSNPLLIGRSNFQDSYFPGYIQHARYSNVERTDFSYGQIDVQPSVGVGGPAAQPIPGSADLAVLGMQAYPDPAGGLLVAAFVQNIGDAGTRSGFYTDLYLDHLPAGVGDQNGSIRFWVNSPIQPGALVTLTTRLDSLSSSSVGSLPAHAVASDFQEDQPASSGPEWREAVSLAEATAPIQEQRATLYAQVDSTGAVRESGKANNVYAPGLELCVASADGLEPNNYVSHAKRLQVDWVYNLNTHVPGDQDWGKFIAQAGVTYVIETSQLGPFADTMLFIYAPDGTTLLASNDDVGDGLASRIHWKAPTDGDYYVMARQWNPRAAGCGTEYSISIRVQPALLFGDCNSDDTIDAGDISALVLEIFDGDGDNPLDAQGGTFAGTQACDANRDGRIDAGDISCTVLMVFDGPQACSGTSAQADDDPANRD